MKITKDIVLYVGITFENGIYMKRTLDNLTVINIPQPVDLPVAVPDITAVSNASSPVVAVVAVIGYTATKNRI